MHGLYASAQAHNQEIDYGATLSPTALRNLYEHSAIHLNVEWRDILDTAWSHQVWI
jgi:maleylpyruvate isomerase